MPADVQADALPGSIADDFNTRGRDWYVDRAVSVGVFVGGVSAIIFIIGIFIFVTREGLGFALGTLDLKEFRKQAAKRWAEHDTKLQHQQCEHRRDAISRV